MADRAKAVIFDLDGVLVDSSRLHFVAWQAWAREVGLEQRVAEAWFRKTFGLRNDAILATLFERPLPPEEVEAHAARKEELFRELARGRIRPLPGAKELIEALHRRGFRLALGTSTPPENVELVLRELELAEHFPARITSADVQRGKPDPEVFLRAAERLSVAPERCVVIEDAEAGVEAAHRAGMACIAVVTTRPSEALATADLIVRSLADLTLENVGRLLP
jgi:beta-phosphoglucomutase family hydrolase